MSEDQLREAADRAFRSLLWRARPRRLQRGVDRLLQLVNRLAAEQPLGEAISVVYSGAREKVVARLARRSPGNAEKTRRLLEQYVPRMAPLDGPDFHCDAGLGGLARWLRAAGYDAAWWPGIDDDALIEHALGGSAILLTTDTRFMTRGVIARGVVAACLISNVHTKREQFLELASRLDLPLKPSRCMACGGSLQPVDKQSVRSLIPPRTWPWQDEYYLCRRCQKLYWQGTHWQRISEVLEARSQGPEARD